MKILLSDTEKEKLDRQHKTERDKRIADRIKAVLLCAEGWSQIQIAQALRIRSKTVHEYLSEYIHFGKLKPDNKGKESLLNKQQIDGLIMHLETHTYLRVIDICYYVEQKYGIKYTVSGMTDWLQRHKFSFKKFKGQPAKVEWQ